MTTDTAMAAEVAVVQAGFAAMAKGDFPGFLAMLHADATWHHRNNDRLGGVYSGPQAIGAMLGGAAELTGGTISAVPQAFMADGEGRVAVLVRVSGTRLDGRTFDVPQILLCAVDDGHVRSVDQFVGDPGAVAAFWA